MAGNQAEPEYRIKQKEEVAQNTTISSPPQTTAGDAIDAIVAKKVGVTDVFKEVSKGGIRKFLLIPNSSEMKTLAVFRGGIQCFC